MTAYTIGDVAEQLGCCKETVARIIRSGGMRAFKVGRSWRVSEESLKLFVKEQERKSRS